MHWILIGLVSLVVLATVGLGILYYWLNHQTDSHDLAAYATHAFSTATFMESTMIEYPFEK